MRRFHFILTSAGLALCTLLPVASQAKDIQSLAQQAQQAASSGKNSQALGLYELALTQSADQPESVFGPLDGQYWALIVKNSDFPRARDFFTVLASQQKSPNATLLANEASATGSYIGWLYQNKLAADLPPETLQKMDASARNNYARSLALDPNNFAALYGYAIYESYSPNGKEHMQELLTKLNSLRATHPHYPWQLVDYLQTHGHPQQ